MTSPKLIRCGIAFRSSPKALFRISRGFFINYRKNNPSKSLTECALEANFYDQSHLIHLSNAITDKCPKEYFGKMNYINDFFIHF